MLVGFKDSLQRLRVHTATRIRNAYVRLPVLRDRLDDDGSFVGKFDRIVNKIEQNLNEPVFVGHHRRKLVRNLADETDRFTFGHETKHVEYAGSDRLHLNALHLQADDTLLETRQIKQVI
ncbi:hypothetical protein D3C85_1555950 [compost metagenome]